MTSADEGQAYWLTTSDTFIAGDGYYATAARALAQHVLPRVPAEARVLDIGCGEGTFTAELAPVAAQVDAFDISPTLIAEAQARNLANVNFSVGDARDAPPQAYDLVSCMGVLVCLVDDDSFATALEAACSAVKPGGHLLLRETLSGWGRRVVRDGDYVACYRSRDAYLNLLGGFDLVVDEQLATWSRLKRRTNHLWLLQRRR